MLATKSYAAVDAVSPLTPYSLYRREPGPGDVVIDIHYCGICHTDLHFVKNELGMTRYPLVPGHEIAGVVESVGEGVTGFAEGDRVGVGCIVNSCRECSSCKEGEEQYCAEMVMTYGSNDVDGTMTQGGYSTRVVVDAKYVLRIPDELPLDAARHYCAPESPPTLRSKSGMSAQDPGSPLLVWGASAIWV